MEFIYNFAVTFSLIKLLFTFLGWYTRDHEDAIYRQNLDKIWDTLKSHSAKYIFYASLKRFVNKMNSIRFTKSVIFLGTFFISFFVAILSYYLTKSSPLTLDKGTIINFSIYSYTCGISALITFWILIGVYKTNKIRKALFALFFEIITTIELTYFGLLFLHFLRLEGSTEPAALAIINLMSNPIPTASFLLSTITMSLFSLWISIFYICVVTGSLILSFSIPRKFITRLIYLITTENKPVISQLGTIFGVFSAILISISSLFH